MYPEEYGGVGADEVTKALVIMEFAKYGCQCWAELLAVHTLSSDIIFKAWHTGAEGKNI